jgi:uncharacterized protein YbbC (DUF1343 family)
MTKVQTGLDRLTGSEDEREKLSGNIAYLGNQASVSSGLLSGLDIMVELFGSRLIRAFGPQHGFSMTAQDNMIESPHEVHPVHGIPVYSLYSETRSPTGEMLEGIDTLIVDLQDTGTRVYTYIWSLFHIMEAIRDRDILLVVLDRPNPSGGMLVQGNLPDKDFMSFVCRSEIPMRHGMTIGELAAWFRMNHFPDAQLEIIRLKGWERWMVWKDTGRAWINPSPNLPTPEGCLVYPGTVLFEGTNISEGRGTTRSLEIIGHPEIRAYQWKEDIDAFLEKNDITGYFLRPVFFEPFFNKFTGRLCGGYQVHVTDHNIFNPWKLGQLLMSFLYGRIDPADFWNTRPYEYEYQGHAIDWINGTDKFRMFIEDNILPERIVESETYGKEEFLELRKECLLY